MKDIEVKTQFMYAANTACPFIAFTFLRFAYLLGYIKKYKTDEIFKNHYERILEQSIKLWIEKKSPGELEMKDPMITSEFEKVFEFHRTHQISFMKSNYDSSIGKLRKILNIVTRKEFNAMVICRGHFFFTIVSLIRNNNTKKFLILDSHNPKISEVGMTGIIDYITKDRKYYGGMDFAIYTIDDMYKEFDIKPELLFEHIEFSLKVIG